MMTDQLREVLDRAALLPEHDQTAVAQVLSGLLDEYAASWPGEAPDLPPELEVIVEESMRKNATLLDYLKDK